MVDCGGGICDYPENCGVECAKPDRQAAGKLLPCVLPETYAVGK
jgi:hypothetical protein